jgi:hypothetical protein
MESEVFSSNAQAPLRFPKKSALMKDLQGQHDSYEPRASPHQSFQHLCIMPVE